MPGPFFSQNFVADFVSGTVETGWSSNSGLTIVMWGPDYSRQSRSRHGSWCSGTISTHAIDYARWVWRKFELPGVGVTKPISSVTSFLSLLQNYQNPGHPYDITFIFGRCHRSWAAETPVKYECDLKYLTYAFPEPNSSIKWRFQQTEL